MIKLHITLISADETPTNCAELLDCNGLQVLIDCYEVNATCVCCPCIAYYSLSSLNLPSWSLVFQAARKGLARYTNCMPVIQVKVFVANWQYEKLVGKYGLWSLPGKKLQDLASLSALDLAGYAPVPQWSLFSHYCMHARCKKLMILCTYTLYNGTFTAPQLCRHACKILSVS